MYDKHNTCTKKGAFKMFVRIFKNKWIVLLAVIYFFTHFLTQYITLHYLGVYYY